jgi:glycine cleavage system regulatory protein
MTTSIVFTFIAEDKPGLVEKLSNTITEQGGNWLESRMSQLAGYFTGIIQVQVGSNKAEELRNALTLLSVGDLSITILEQSSNDTTAEYKHAEINLVGNDRPGIVRELSSALAAHHINVCEMNTRVTSAPMTADPLFEAIADIQVPVNLDINKLSDDLDEIANELDVDINLEL